MKKDDLYKKSEEICTKVEKDIDKIASEINTIKDISMKGAALGYIIARLMSASKLPAYALVGVLEILKNMVLNTVNQKPFTEPNYFA